MSSYFINSSCFPATSLRKECVTWPYVKQDSPRNCRLPIWRIWRENSVSSTGQKSLQCHGRTLSSNLVRNILYISMQLESSKLIYTTVQKIGVSKISFLNKLILLFRKDALNWSEVTVKVCIKYFYFKKCRSFELPVHQRIKKYQFPQKYEAAQPFSMLMMIIIIRNVSWAANQHIRMISEGSCDTEDWSNDAGYSALITEINYILFKQKTAILNCINISQYDSFFCHSSEHNRLISKMYWPQTFKQ